MAHHGHDPYPTTDRTPPRHRRPASTAWPPVRPCTASPAAPSGRSSGCSSGRPPASPPASPSRSRWVWPSSSASRCRRCRSSTPASGSAPPWVWSWRPTRLSIATMELVDNAVMAAIPGAMDAGLVNPVFWLAMSLSLAGGVRRRLPGQPLPAGPREGARAHPRLPRCDRAGRWPALAGARQRRAGRGHRHLHARRPRGLGRRRPRGRGSVAVPRTPAPGGPSGAATKRNRPRCWTTGGGSISNGGGTSARRTPRRPAVARTSRRSVAGLSASMSAPMVGPEQRTRQATIDRQSVLRAQSSGSSGKPCWTPQTTAWVRLTTSILR